MAPWLREAYKAYTRREVTGRGHMVTSLSSSTSSRSSVIMWSLLGETEIGTESRREEPWMRESSAGRPAGGRGGTPTPPPTSASFQKLRENLCLHQRGPIHTQRRKWHLTLDPQQPSGGHCASTKVTIGCWVTLTQQPPIKVLNFIQRTLKNGI